MSEFTKGKWSVGIDKKYGPYVYADDSDAIIAVIRNCGHTSQSKEKESVRHANARLIAAAPELYNLLLRAAYGGCEDCVPVFMQAREILARIDGKDAKNNA